MKDYDLIKVNQAYNVAYKDTNFGIIFFKFFGIIAMLSSLWSAFNRNFLSFGILLIATIIFFEIADYLTNSPMSERLKPELNYLKRNEGLFFGRRY